MAENTQKGFKITGIYFQLEGELANVSQAPTAPPECHSVQNWATAMEEDYPLMKLNWK